MSEPASKTERFFEVFNEIVTLDEKTKNPETTLESLNLDSLDRVELVMNMEEEFDLDVDDDAAEAWQTVGDILNYVEEHGT